jgi:hypothetical protein
METSLRRLWESGIPALKFRRFFTVESTLHVSGHLPVDLTYVAKPLSTAAPDFSGWLNKATMAEGSQFLLTNTIRASSEIIFTTEDDIHALVGLLLSDVLRIIGLTGAVSLRRCNSLTNEQPTTKSSNTDYWVIKINDGRPLAVVLIKSPTTQRSTRTVQKRNILDDPHTVGQAIDYMLALRSFSGQRDVSCIATTLQDFQFHWLQGSDPFVTPDKLPISSGQGEVELGPQARVASSSKIYPHYAPDLLKTLATIIIKAYCSTHEPVHTVHAQRMYILLDAEGWRWHRLSGAEAASISAEINGCLNASAECCSHFLVLKALCHRGDRKVWLTITGGRSPCLAVIKQCSSRAEAEGEAATWKAVNSCDAAFSTRVSGYWSVVTPLVIPLRENTVGEFTFKFDLRNWCAVNDVIVGSLPDNLRQLSEDMQAMAPLYKEVREVAIQAVERAALQRVVHEDLEFRHIALLPVLGGDGRLQSLVPVLIDFGRVRTVATVVEAGEIMLVRLRELLGEDSDLEGEEDVV